MQVQLLKRHLSAGSAILEIGCGEGILLNALKKQGFKVTGVEPSREAFQRAQARGLQVYQGYFPHERLRASGTTFDAVVLSHVLEHISDPLPVLREVAASAPGGKLLLVQTNWRGLVPRARKSKWYAWVPDQHFWHFTPTGLATITAALGFIPIECEYSDLVHTRIPSRLLVALSRINGKWKDQFHLLLRLPPSGREGSSHTVNKFSSTCF